MSQPTIHDSYNQRMKLIEQRANEYINILEKESYLKLSTTEGFNEQEIKRIISLIEASGKFTAKQRFQLNTWDITINPNYDINQSIIKTNNSVQSSITFQQKIGNRTLLALLFSALLSLGSFIISILEISDKTTQIELKEQAESLQKIESALQQMNQTVEKYFSDTLKVSILKNK